MNMNITAVCFDFFPHRLKLQTEPGGQLRTKGFQRYHKIEQWKSKIFNFEKKNLKIKPNLILKVGYGVFVFAVTE